MGQIFVRFAGLDFHNEAEVSQNFLIPLLTEFLGYRADEILPEHLYPSVDIPLNREKRVSTDQLPPHAKPDYVITLDQQQIVAVCDSKGPQEKVDEYFEQLIAYCLAVKTNLLLITNGIEVRVYDAHNLIFHSSGIEDLDPKFSELFKLLSRDNASQFTGIQRIQSLDLARSLSQDSETLLDERHRQVAVALSDFILYLNQTLTALASFDLPVPIQSAFEVDWRRFSAEELYSLQEYDTGELGFRTKTKVTYSALRKIVQTTPILLVGESGIGKSSLLQQILIDQAQDCLALRSDIVPVLLKLGQYSNSIYELILQSFNSKGASISIEEISGLLRNGRLMLLLDAFDEVFDKDIPSVERQVQSLVEGYPQCKIVVTTRYFRLPRVQPLIRYQLLPLSQETVRAFSKTYLGGSHEEFLVEVERQRLVSVASNTLLLSLLILVYMKDGTLPQSRARVLHTIVDHVRSRDIAKMERFAVPVQWEARFQMLVQLAFVSFSRGQNYAVDEEFVEQTLIEVVGGLESRRKVPTGLTIEQILESLAATGFVVRAGNGIVFWHRAFVEYFAAFEIARRIESDIDFLDNIISQPDWNEIIPQAVAKARNPSELIARIISRNVFTAARSLVESQVTEESVIRLVVDRLMMRCNSSTRPIRILALGLLRELQGHDVDVVFHDLLTNSKYLHVQMASLVELAQRKVPDARDLVYSRLGWDVNSPHDWLWDGPSFIAVIEALGEFDDGESQLQIVDFWRKEPDMFTTSSCREALLKVASRGQITEETKEALLDLFLSEEKDVISKVWELKDILIGLHDVALAPRLISDLKETESPERWRSSVIVDVLASYADQSLIRQLIDSALDRSLNDFAGAGFTEALSGSQGQVPLEVFLELSRDTDDHIRGHAVKGLRRFPFEQVREAVLNSIHSPSEDELYQTGFSFALVQAAAFEVLAQNNQIELLLDKAHAPTYYFNISLEVLFRAISDKRLLSMVPLLDTFVERTNNDREVINAAWVYADLGYIDRAVDIVERVRRRRFEEGWTTEDILAGVHRLPVNYALDIVDGVIFKDGHVDLSGSSYRQGLCVEAYERIGTSDACERLAQIAWETANDEGLLPERALRAIEYLGPKDREDWLLSYIREHPKTNALHRALDTLAIIGTQKSLPLLEQYFTSHHSERIRATCFSAMHNIYRRAGVVWLNDEEKAH